MTAANCGIRPVKNKSVQLTRVKILEGQAIPGFYPNNILYGLINDSRSRWPTKMLIPFLGFSYILLQDNYILLSKKVFKNFEITQKSGSILLSFIIMWCLSVLNRTAFTVMPKDIGVVDAQEKLKNLFIHFTQNS